MTQQTSTDVYNEIKNKGLLTHLRWEVYNCLYTNGPLTQAETSRIIGNHGENQGITPRFAELQRMGVIRKIGKRRCTVTGYTVFEWGLTDQLPQKTAAPLRSLKAEIMELQKQIQELKKINAQLVQIVNDKQEEPV